MAESLTAAEPYKTAGTLLKQGGMSSSSSSSSQDAPEAFEDPNYVPVL